MNIEEFLELEDISGVDSIISSGNEINEEMLIQFIAKITDPKSQVQTLYLEDILLLENARYRRKLLDCLKDTKITNLSLVTLNLNAEDALEIAQHLQDSNITHLNLSDNVLGNDVEDKHKLFENFIINLKDTKVESLTLNISEEHDFFIPGSFIPLFAHLKDSNVKKLYLANNQLNIVDVKKLVELLAGTEVNTLDISGNDLFESDDNFEDDAKDDFEDAIDNSNNINIPFANTKIRKLFLRRTGFNDAEKLNSLLNDLKLSKIKTLDLRDNFPSFRNEEEFKTTFNKFKENGITTLFINHVEINAIYLLLESLSESNISALNLHFSNFPESRIQWLKSSLDYDKLQTLIQNTNITEIDGISHEKISSALSYNKALLIKDSKENGALFQKVFDCFDLVDRDIIVHEILPMLPTKEYLRKAFIEGYDEAAEIQEIMYQIITKLEREVEHANSKRENICDDDSKEPELSFYQESKNPPVTYGLAHSFSQLSAPNNDNTNCEDNINNESRKKRKGRAFI